MKENIKKHVLATFGYLLQPIIKLALRNGVTYREFADLSKKLYVHVAAQDYGVHGRQTNVSRMALITGLNRKEIKRIKDLIVGGESLYEENAPDRISRLLAGWHQDPDFLNANGQPLELPVDGATISFTELIRRYGGDIAVITLLREFKRSKVITETESGHLRILKRYYIPNPSSNLDDELKLINPHSIRHASSILNDHIATIFHNLYREDTDIPAKFERRATNHLIDKAVVPEFKHFAEKLGQRFLEEVDDWLSSHEAHASTPASKQVRLGMGAYWIEGADENSILG